jgi:Ca2+-binding EF-hand superfamily protein
MKNKDTIKITSICIAALLICGCVNYEQETFLNPDMSGRIEIHVFPNPQPMVEEIAKKINEEDKSSLNLNEVLSKATYKMKVKIKEEDLLKAFNIEAIKSKSFREVEKDGITHVYLTVEFGDIRKLFKEKKSVSVVEGQNGLVTYTQFFNLSKDGKEDGASENKPSELFKGFNFKCILHMPADIMSANTLNIDKNTAVWEFPLKQVMEDKNLNITATCRSVNRRPI